MLSFTSVLAEIRRREGAIQLRNEEPSEIPPWTEPGRDERSSQGVSPRRVYRIRLNTPGPRQEKNGKPQYSLPTGIPTSPTYARYRPLATANDKRGPEIRLLRLLPGRDQEHLGCELICAGLADPPAYEALSYCWGEAATSVELRCDGSLVSITPNLAAALRTLRSGTDARTLWVDSVCINQGDKDEKQQQVPLMGQIYRQATAVQVWLGEEEEEEDVPHYTVATAFRILSHLRALCERFGWDIDFNHLARYRTFDQYGLPDVADDAWKSITRLLERPWFSRTWIIQEIMLSRQATLHCGMSSLSWTDFCIGLLSLSQGFWTRRPDIMPSLFSYMQTMQLVLTYHKANHASTPHRLDLLALLENHRVARASDARDKVYAFLGIFWLTTGRAHNILPNYHRTWQESYIEASRAIVEYSPTLDILGVPQPQPQPEAAGGRQHDGETGSPSWVPDWSASVHVSSLSCKTIDGSYYFDFDAARTRDIPKYAQVQGRTLEVEGFCFDQVTRVGCPADPYLMQEGESGGPLRLSLSPSAAMLFIGVHMNWLILCGALSGDEYPNGQDVFDAFVRTIHLDHFPSTDLSADQTAEWYRRLYVPFHVLGQPWRGPSAISILPRLALLAYSVLGRLLGPSILMAAARAIIRMERRVPVYAFVTLSQKPTESSQIPASTLTDSYIRSASRRMFCTQSGYIGLGPTSTQTGDRVFLVKGCRTPLLFRPQGGQWKLLGDCYVHGIMRGEAFTEGKCSKFTII